ncbi:MAG: hypothetical protein IGS48_03740 [Oscillatoriales cyanobacterium C42_A2020_001]|nr:hypothetical protein [Leptolyngbyaceae cyanobacterium C42_A2020_001]
MTPVNLKRFTWVSLTLLFLCYTWFGWYLAGLQTQPAWLPSACYQLLSAPTQRATVPDSPDSTQPSTISTPNQVPETAIAPSSQTAELQPAKPLESSTSPQKPPHLANQPSQPAVSSFSRSTCDFVIQHNLPAGFLAVSWVFLSSMAFISPLTSFSGFISRWFKSDTVAMLTLFMLAGMAAVILYWLHLFLQILTILATDVLARIDIQCLGLSGIQAFWILVSISLTGLVSGWIGNAIF